MISRLLSLAGARRWLGTNTPLLERLLIIVGVLAVSAYLAPTASQRYLLGILGLVTTAAFLRWPPLGLVALVPAALVVPLSINTGTQTSLNAAVLLVPVLLVLWILSMILRRGFRLAPSRPILPLLAFAAAATLSFLVGNQPLLAFAQTAPMNAQLGGLAVFLLSAGVFLLASHQIGSLSWLRAVTWMFLSLGAVYILMRLTPAIGGAIYRFFPRGTDGSLFWVWLIAMAFSQAVFNNQLRWTWRLCLIGLVLSAFYVALAQSGAWVSGWLPPLVALVVILLVGEPRTGLALAMLGAGAVLLEIDKIVSFVMIGDNAWSLLTRFAAWRIIEEIVKINPILGLGPANYWWYTPLFPILGYNAHFNSHNNYLDIMAQTGIVGFALFLWFACAVGRLAWQVRDRVPAGFGRAYVIASLGGLAGTMAAGTLGDWVLPFVYNIGLTGFRASVLGWMFLGGLVALEQISRRADWVDTQPKGHLVDNQNQV